jgi:hypothetical protein
LFKKLPSPTIPDDTAKPMVQGAVGTAKEDWDSFETSWDFQKYKRGTLRGCASHIQISD